MGEEYLLAWLPSHVSGRIACSIHYGELVVLLNACPTMRGFKRIPLKWRYLSPPTCG